MTVTPGRRRLWLAAAVLLAAVVGSLLVLRSGPPKTDADARRKLARVVPSGERGWVRQGPVLRDGAAGPALQLAEREPGAGLPNQVVLRQHRARRSKVGRSSLFVVHREGIFRHRDLAACDHGRVAGDHGAVARGNQRSLCLLVQATPPRELGGSKRFGTRIHGNARGLFGSSGRCRWTRGRHGMACWGRRALSARSGQSCASTPSTHSAQSAERACALRQRPDEHSRARGTHWPGPRRALPSRPSMTLEVPHVRRVAHRAGEGGPG